MFTENDLRELSTFKSSHPVVSLYLNTEPSKGNADEHKLRLRSLLKRINQAEDVEAIERFFDYEYDWSGRGIVIFSCASQSFFRSYSVSVPIHDRVQISDHPGVKPLATLLDHYGGYGVILTDKQGARLFSFHMGELREQEGVLGEAVRHTKGGGDSAVPGRRGGVAGQPQFMEETVDRNMKDSADFAVHFFEQNHVRRILIGGTDENVAKLRTLLPKAWQSLIFGSFPVSMNANHAEVLAKAMSIGLETRERRDGKLVNTLITNAAKANNAVVGLEKTLAAINEGRVHTLMLTEDYHPVGYRCVSCGHLLSMQNGGNSTPQCLDCEGTVESVEDVVELAVSEIMRHGSEVEFILNNPYLENAGSIGALLRY